MGRLNRQLNPTQTGSEADKLDSDLRKRIVGQDEAIQQIISVYQTHLGRHVHSGKADRQSSLPGTYRFG